MFGKKLGSFDRCKYTWMLGKELGSFDRCKYMNVRKWNVRKVSIFMYVCIMYHIFGVEKLRILGMLGMLDAI